VQHQILTDILYARVPLVYVIQRRLGEHLIHMLRRLHLGPHLDVAADPRRPKVPKLHVVGACAPSARPLRTARVLTMRAPQPDVFARVKGPHCGDAVQFGQHVVADDGEHAEGVETIARTAGLRGYQVYEGAYRRGGCRLQYRRMNELVGGKRGDIGIHTWNVSLRIAFNIPAVCGNAPLERV
jgi:hypothetical protein